MRVHSQKAYTKTKLKQELKAAEALQGRANVKHKVTGTLEKKEDDKKNLRRNLTEMQLLRARSKRWILMAKKPNDQIGKYSYAYAC